MTPCAERILMPLQRRFATTICGANYTLVIAQNWATYSEDERLHHLRVIHDMAERAGIQPLSNWENQSLLAESHTVAPAEDKARVDAELQSILDQDGIEW